MIYVTVKQSPVFKQMSIEDLLFGDFDNKKFEFFSNGVSSTKTYAVSYLSERMSKNIGVDIDNLIDKLKAFNNNYADLMSMERRELYSTFHIPKRSGGLRKIDNPCPELKNALYVLKGIFENDFHAMYHTSAFAYVKGRSTVTAVKKHQANESNWFGKFDLTNFFGSTTIDFTMKMLSMIYPFSSVIEKAEGEAELRKALDLAFLDGGLPQGTPLSPMLTNIIMIPIDFELNKEFRNLNGKKFVYTRYADDFHISSRTDFKVSEVEDAVIKVLEKYGAPFSLNRKKTRYGSSAGRNWILGTMLNSNNEITVGHKKKKQVQAMIHNYIRDKKSGIDWDKNDVQVLSGYISYIQMVEGDVANRIVEHMNQKNDVDLFKMIKEDIAK